MNQCFKHPAAVEILDSKTGKYDKIRALYCLSNNIFSAHALARYFNTTQAAIHSILNGNESEMPFHDEDATRGLNGEIIGTARQKELRA